MTSPFYGRRSSRSCFGYELGRRVLRLAHGRGGAACAAKGRRL